MEACVCPYHPDANLYLSSDMTDLFNMQWIRDSNGNATPLTIDEEQGIRVIVEGRIYPGFQPSDTPTGTVLINGEEKGYTVALDWDTFYKTGFYSAPYWVFGKLDKYQYSDCLEITSSTTDFDGTQPDSVTVNGLTVTAVWEPNTFVGELNSVCFRVWCNHSQGGYQNFIAFRLDEPITVTDTMEITIQATRQIAATTELTTELNTYNPYSQIRCE
jgi:hypothetical protein